MIQKREIFIDGTMYEVEDSARYIKNPDAYLAGHIALDFGLDMIYPVVSATSQLPGVVIKNKSPFARVIMPEQNIDQYSRDNIIDYTKADSFKSFIEKQNMVRELEREVLTSPDNIYTPPEDEKDTPAMKALKEAVVEKHIDLDKYEQRFGSNYNNDKRIFNKNNISLPMLVRMCNGLDIKATLTLEDQKIDGVDEPANPIGRVISVELTSGNDQEE